MRMIMVIIIIIIMIPLRARRAHPRRRLPLAGELSSLSNRSALGASPDASITISIITVLVVVLEEWTLLRSIGAETPTVRSE